MTRSWSGSCSRVRRSVRSGPSRPASIGRSLRRSVTSAVAFAGRGPSPGPACRPGLADHGEVGDRLAPPTAGDQRRSPSSTSGKSRFRSGSSRSVGGRRRSPGDAAGLAGSAPRASARATSWASPSRPSELGDRPGTTSARSLGRAGRPGRGCRPSRGSGSRGTSRTASTFCSRSFFSFSSFSVGDLGQPRRSWRVLGAGRASARAVGRAGGWRKRVAADQERRPGGRPGPRGRSRGATAPA